MDSATMRAIRAGEGGEYPDMILRRSSLDSNEEYTRSSMRRMCQGPQSASHLREPFPLASPLLMTLSTTRSSISGAQSVGVFYEIHPSVEILQPLKDNGPYLSKSGFSTVHLSSLAARLWLPFQPIVLELLSRLQVHDYHMSPHFYRMLALCHMMCHQKEGK